MEKLVYEIKEKLENLPYKIGEDSLRELFIETLNYSFEDRELSKDIFSSRIRENINSIKIIAKHNDFKIFFTHLKKILLSHEKEIIKKLISSGYPYALFIFSDEKTNRTIHLVNLKFEKEREKTRKLIRRMVIAEGETLRTISERLSCIEIKQGEDLDALKVQERHDVAFDVEKVTEEFFNSYKSIMELITDELAKQGVNEERGRFFAIQLLNRMMFIYFVQKKGWLRWSEESVDKKYLFTLFEKYRKKWKTKNSNFYRDYLSALFFYAFNRNFGFRMLNLPREVKISFSLMPFLNGGLFTKNEFDIEEIYIKDRIFEIIFKELLERFNFTIREDIPFDVEVAVDPEMLGKVYESLVHGEERKERHKAGIFYTPRIEIDYMIKLSLSEYLIRNSKIEREKIIKFVFSEGEENSELTEDEKYELRMLLNDIKILDPAVGSGSFLVRSMNILVNLIKNLGIEGKIFDLRKKIIKDSLYGVDVMEWAVRVAELRLWLNLIVDADKNEIDIYSKPLLPNLSFKIRQGDSLIQEIYGQEISLREKERIPPQIKRLVNEIRKEKEIFYSGLGGSKEKINKLEEELLFSIYNIKRKEIENQIKRISNKMKDEWDNYSRKQKMFGEDRKEREEFERRIEEMDKERESLKEELEKLKNEFENLKTKQKNYFLWDIDFSDVFLNKGGFDIVIGNPPYVRQEEISPPLLSEENTTKTERDKYKKKLKEMVRKLWSVNVSGRSDLYVYFYFLSLSLLNERGTFCFINSNSWLDVGYGKELQEFLVRNFEIKKIIDNQVARTFKEADVNTVIVLINKPDKQQDVLKNIVKFILFKKPFEDVISIENEILIDGVKEKIFKNKDFRVFPISQKDLLLDGIEGGESEEEKLLRGKYEGGKWGGKYLRAPDIFFTILEKGKGKFVKLGDIAEVKRGFTTGANEFFYVEDITDQIEDA